MAAKAALIANHDADGHGKQLTLRNTGDPWAEAEAEAARR